jgi:hypothetical protein
MTHDLGLGRRQLVASCSRHGPNGQGVTPACAVVDRLQAIARVPTKPKGKEVVEDSTIDAG